MSVNESVESSVLGGIEEAARQKLTAVLTYLQNAMNKPFHDLTEHEYKTLNFISINCQNDQKEKGFTLSFPLIKQLYSEIEYLPLFNDIESLSL